MNFVLLTVSFAFASALDGPYIPREIEACLKRLSAQRIAIDVAVNPFYVRGDFDGDGRMDVAIRAMWEKPENGRLAVCMGSGHNAVVGTAGSAKTRPFSSMPHDRFWGTSWEIVDRSKAQSWSSRKLAIKGEAIAMHWETESGLVYWDGANLRWAAVDR